VTTPTFGLYPTPALVSAQRATAGQVVDLDRPVVDGGATLFRKSYWLPVSATLAQAQAAGLAADSTLAIEFSPQRYAIGTDDADWFPAVESLSAHDVRITFAWPAPVVRVAHPLRDTPHAIELFRVDGKAVAAEPALTGVTGADLAEPWVGSPLVLHIGEPVSGVRAAIDDRRVRAGRARAASRAAVEDEGRVRAQVRARFTRVPALTVAGTPTSPRLKLFAEQPAGATLLWQAMAAGVQGAALALPGGAIADEWAAAIEQLRSLLANPATAPTRLRLDIESDAPCRTRFAALQLTLEAELELLQAPQKLGFGGARLEEATLALELPAGVAARGLKLVGRVVADAAGAPAAGSAPPDGRRGALLAADQVALQLLDLPAPARLAGLALYWQPLSQTARLRLRLLLDDGNGPGAKALAVAEASIETPQAGWLALRWEAIDVQAQRLWAELTVIEGSGLWPFGVGPAGRIETHATPPLHQDLPEALALQVIGTGSDGAATRPIAVRCGAQVLQPALPAAALVLEVPPALLATLSAQPVVFAAAVRGSVTIESARLRVGA
jgi:hypothetical protein